MTTPSKAPTGLELMDEAPGRYRLFRQNDLRIVVWLNHAVGDTVARLSNVMERQATGAKHSDVHVILSGVGLPNADARAGLVELMRNVVDEVACIGVVLHGGGFWASAMRSAVIGLSMLAKSPIPLRVVGSVSELLAWLPGEHQRATGIALDPNAVRQAITAASEWAPRPPAIAEAR